MKKLFLSAIVSSLALFALACGSTEAEVQVVKEVQEVEVVKEVPVEVVREVAVVEERVKEVEVIKEVEVPALGACSSHQGDLSVKTGAFNLFFLFSPLLFLIFYKLYRKRLK